MRIILVIALLILHTLLSLLFNMPQDAGIDVAQGKLNSLSYAPYREGQNPFESIFPKQAQIDEDLKLLANKTYSIRTYASAEGSVPAIAPIAQKYGLKLIQGAWLGSDLYVEGKKSNDKEVQALIKAANTYPDVIKRVIVGNEVLLRGELNTDKLIDYIRTVKKAIKQPVSYADVWSMYMKHPQLINEVDFITIHILPYWEDVPISAQDAAKHIEQTYQLVKKEIKAVSNQDKAILIGETGWPSMGRQRGFAIPSILNEAKVIRALLDVAKKDGFDVNVVEAINQPWKSELEGVVGANWGLLSKDRKDVFELTGKVSEHANWFLIESIGLGLFLTLTLLSWRLLNELSLIRMAILLIIAQVLSVLLIEQSQFLWYTSYSDWQRAQSIIIVILSSLFALFVLKRHFELFAQRQLTPPTWLFMGISHQLITQQQYLSGLTHRVFILFTIYALFESSLLTFNGRYISFPIIPCLIAITGLVSLIITQSIVQGRFILKSLDINLLLNYNNVYANQDKLIGYSLIVLIFGVIIGEIKGFIFGSDFILAYPDLISRVGMAAFYTFCNTQLLLWLAYLIIFALPLLIGNKTSLQHDWLSRLAFRQLV